MSLFIIGPAAAVVPSPFPPMLGSAPDMLTPLLSENVQLLHYIIKLNKNCSSIQPSSLFDLVMFECFRERAEHVNWAWQIVKHAKSAITGLFWSFILKIYFILFEVSCQIVAGTM